MNISKKLIANLAAVIAAGITLSACGHNPAEVSDKTQGGSRNGVVNSDLVLGKVGVLSKTATINLRKVHFTLVSSAADTVRDSATVAGNEQVIVNKQWSLKPLRTWTIHARSVDAKDSPLPLRVSRA